MAGSGVFCATYLWTYPVSVDRMLKLRIAVGMIGASFSLAIALQAVIQIVKYLRHLHVAHRMLLLAQFLGHRPRTFCISSAAATPDRLAYDPQSSRPTPARAED